jgi:hypothetical protein
MNRHAYTHQWGTGGSLQRQTPAYCSAEYRRGSSISCAFAIVRTGVPELTFLTLVSATRWACTRRQHCQTIPVLCRLTTSTNANSCAFIMCFLQHLAGAQMVLARAAASDEIVHTPHINRADTAGPDHSQLNSTHTHRLTEGIISALSLM